MNAPQPLRTRVARALGVIAVWLLAAGGVSAGVIFETYSPYHHVQVIDERGLRTLSFDGTHETRMLLSDPLQGHFEYTEFFHFAWLWNTNLSRVLMLGLGGGSTQRAFLHYYPAVTVESVELDPVVVKVATNYFGVPISDRHQVRNQDGRAFLKRSGETWDLIILDAYTRHRYGSAIPPHLATREFFELAASRLTTNGVLAYNVITTGALQGVDAGSAIARTLLAVFPQVYCFHATQSRNVVLMATRQAERWSNTELARRGAALVQGGLNPPPGLFSRLRTFRTEVPATARRAPVLTDDFAPVEALGRKGRE